MTDPLPDSMLFLAAGGGTVPTRLDEFASQEYLNVKHFGPSVGTGGDDTDAIQDCLDAAFGPYDDPFALRTPAVPSKAVFFPGGGFLVRPKWSRTVTGTSDSSGEAVVTVNSSITGSLVDGDMVYVNGVAGTTGANGAFGVVIVSSTQIRLIGSVYNAAFTSSSGTLKPPALRVRQVQGGHIFGIGKLSTYIYTDTAATITFCANGIDSSRIETLTLATPDSVAGIALNLNYSAQVGDVVETNNNIVYGCAIYGGSEGGACISIGGSGPCANNVVMCCLLGVPVPRHGDGLAIYGAGSVNNSVIGGNMAGCGASEIGCCIHIYSGSCSVSSVGFQNYWITQPAWDIIIENEVTDALMLSGCRSESFYFLKVGASCTAPLSLLGDVLLSGDSSTYFYKGGGKATLSGCAAPGGNKILGEGAAMVINGCTFAAGALDTSSNFSSLSINPLPITTQSGTSYTIKDSDGGTKIRFDNGSSIAVSLNSASFHLGPGTKIEVQQVGAGQVTFSGSGVTIRNEASPKGLKLRSQWSCATLICDAANVWTLTGDTAV